MTNQEKNTYVKEQLTRALFEELKEKELKDISISQLAEAAGVNRVSFYRSFKTKEDIITNWMYQTLVAWIAEHKDPDDPSSTEGNAFIRMLFQYLMHYQEIYKRLYKRGLLELFRQAMLKFHDPKLLPDNYTAYGVSFMVNGMYGWIEEWVARGMIDTPEAMYAVLDSQNKG